MEIRDVRPSDADGVRAVARASFDASYGHALEDDTIEQVVETEYAPEAIEEGLASGASIVVAATDAGLAGFAQGRLVQGEPLVGDVLWLHVHPDERGRGVGVRLLGALLDSFEDDDAGLVRGHVIEANEEGTAFYERHGFERVSTNEVEIAGESHDEIVLEARLDRADGETLVDQIDGSGGGVLFVDYAGGETGTEAPLYPVYRDRSLEERYGWFCSACESTETAMDASGRVRCGACGNARTATRWDRSYL